MTGFNMTEVRQRILASAKGAAGIVSRRFNFGVEAATEKRNIAALVAADYLKENAHGDWYITEKGRGVLASQGNDNG